MSDWLFMLAMFVGWPLGALAFGGLLYGLMGGDDD